jgi:hypothetical protein
MKHLADRFCQFTIKGSLFRNPISYVLARLIQSVSFCPWRDGMRAPSGHWQSTFFP